MITPEELIGAGYREIPVPPIWHCQRVFQKAIEWASRRQYFINFRQWHLNGRFSFDAELCCETASTGNVWATIGEASIEATEARAEAIWRAAGAIPYEREVNA